MEKQRVLVLGDGRRLPVLGETDRYFVCAGTRFRKHSPAIVSVEEIRPARPEEQAGEPEGRPEKKKSPKRGGAETPAPAEKEGEHAQE